MPFQLGATVADAILAPTRTRSCLCWAAYRVDVTYLEELSRNATLEAHARLEFYNSTLARFAIVASSGKNRFAEARVHYVLLQGGRNLATGAVTQQSEVAPTALVDRFAQYSPFLVQLLMNPLGVSQEPLGRRLHPLASVSFGSALYQANRLIPGARPHSASAKYLRPMRTDFGFTASARLSKEDTVEVDSIDASGVHFAAYSIRFSRGNSGCT